MCNVRERGTSTSPGRSNIFYMRFMHFLLIIGVTKMYCWEANHTTRTQYRVPCNLLHVKYSLCFFFKQERDRGRVTALYCPRPLENWDTRIPFEEWECAKKIKPLKISKIWNQKQCKRSGRVTFPVTDNFPSFVQTWHFSGFHSTYTRLLVPDICYANMVTLICCLTWRNIRIHTNCPSETHHSARQQI